MAAVSVLITELFITPPGGLMESVGDTSLVLSILLVLFFSTVFVELSQPLIMANTAKRSANFFIIFFLISYNYVATFIFIGGFTTYRCLKTKEFAVG